LRIAPAALDHTQPDQRPRHPYRAGGDQMAVGACHALVELGRWTPSDAGDNDDDGQRPASVMMNAG
jgi:hypothetical protein